MTSAQLFPAWHLSQQQALQAANFSPRIIELTDTDLAAVRRIHQPEIDWVLLISPLATAHTEIVTVPLAPDHLVPFTIQWNRTRAHAPAAARFVAVALAIDPRPDGRPLPATRGPRRTDRPLARLAKPDA